VPPSEAELNEKMVAFLKSMNLFDNAEEQALRERSLVHLSEIVQSWARDACAQKACTLFQLLAVSNA